MKSARTKDAILKASKEEFLEKGYKDANMRNIAARAGVTTGAIYGAYDDKHALFQALVEPMASDFINQFETVLISFQELPETNQVKEMHGYCSHELDSLLDYIYANFDSFRLIRCCSAGTEYENYIDRLIELEMEATIRFIEVLKAQRYQPMDLSRNLIHILTNAYFSTVFETVVHNMDKDEADAYVRYITTFFSAGWDALFKMQ